ncbi:MAG: hypothetical protein JWO11_4324 [Nocardioides sp.]|nr:hypothetical protein [Nocardioides sp.]
MTAATVDPPVAPAPDPEPGRRRRALAIPRLRHCIAVAAAGALILLAIPALSGVPWSSIGSILGAVPVIGLTGLFLVWVLGLLAHTITLTAALPTLTHRRALTLSLTGSAVANVLPVGGAAGVALNYRMARTWGFDRGQIAAYTVVTNVWDVLAKLVLPLLALPLLLLTAHSTVHQLLGPVAVGTAALALVAGLALATFVNASVAHRVGTVAESLTGMVLRGSGSQRQVEVRKHLVDLQARCGPLMRQRWRRLTLGMSLYTTSLLILLWACLHLTAAGLAPTAVLAAFAVERLLTLPGLTPGGAGVVEVGLSGALLVLGGLPAGVVAGVLLYRALTFGLEIPVGGIGLLGWWWARRRAAVRGAAGLPSTELVGSA